MALTDVCKFEVKKEIDDMVKEGLSRNEAASRLAKMYSETLATNIKPETIRQKDKRARGIATGHPGTNVPKKGDNAKLPKEKKPSENQTEPANTPSLGVESKTEVGTNVPTKRPADIPQDTDNLMSELEKRVATVRTGITDLQVMLFEAEADGWKQLPYKIVRKCVDVLKEPFDGLMEILAMNAPVCNPDPRQIDENTAQEEPSTSESLDAQSRGDELPCDEPSQAGALEASPDGSEEPGPAETKSAAKGESEKRKRPKKTKDSFSKLPEAQVDAEAKIAEKVPEAKSEEHPVGYNDGTSSSFDALDAPVAVAEAGQGTAADANVEIPPGIEDAHIDQRDVVSPSSETPDATVANDDVTQDNIDGSNEECPWCFGNGVEEQCQNRCKCIPECSALHERQTASSSPDVLEAPVDKAYATEKAPETKSEKRPACFGDGGHPNGRCNGCKDVNECMKAYFAKMREEKQAA